MKKLSKLSKLIKKHNLLPGSIVPAFYLSESTIRRYVKKDWLKYNGKYVLTISGYKEN